MTPLTENEIKLITLVSRGLGVYEIAVTFGVTIAAIEAMTARIIEKLDAKTRPHAVANAFRMGLIS